MMQKATVEVAFFMAVENRCATVEQWAVRTVCQRPNQ